MSLVITEPIKTVNGLLTKALAARSQVLYGFQREDFTIESVVQSTANVGQLRVFLSKTTYTAQPFQTGSQIFLGGGDTDIYHGLYTVGAELGDGASWKFELGGVFDVVNQNGGYVNDLTDRANYRIAVQIFLGDGTLMFQSVFRYVPNQAGSVSVDFSTVIELYLSLNPFATNYYLEVTEEWTDKVFNYTFNSVANVGNVVFDIDTSFGIDIGSRFFVGQIINVIFDDTAIPYVDSDYSIVAITFPASTRTRLEIDYPFPGVAVPDTGSFTVIPFQVSTLQAVYGKKQLLKQGGANMWENLLREVNTFESAVSSIIESPTPGLTSVVTMTPQPFAVDDYIEILTEPYGAANSKGLVLTTGADFIRTDIAFIETVGGATRPTVINTIPATLLTRFTNPKMWRGWNRTVAVLIDQEYENRIGSALPGFVDQESTDVNKSVLADLTLTVMTTTPSVFIYQFVEGLASAFYQRLRIRDQTQAAITSETLFYQVEDPCPEPIMLDWINSKGGVDQWLFAIDQGVENTSGDGVLAERPITEDIEFVNRTKQRFPGATIQRITCSAEHLTRDQVIALKEIKETNSLRVYLSKDGTNFIDAVVVRDFATPFNTKERLHKYSVTIEFPDEFDFFDGKLY